MGGAVRGLEIIRLRGNQLTDLPRSITSIYCHQGRWLGHHALRQNYVTHCFVFTWVEHLRIGLTGVGVLRRCEDDAWTSRSGMFVCFRGLLSSKGSQLLSLVLHSPFQKWICNLVFSVLFSTSFVFAILDFWLWNRLCCGLNINCVCLSKFSAPKILENNFCPRWPKVQSTFSYYLFW